MKKLVIYLAIALFILALTPTFAMATTREQEICNIAMQNPKVVKAKCIIFERNCLVAIQTEKFTNRTEYSDFLAKFEDQVKAKYQIDNIKVTRSPKVMCKLDQLEKLNENERNAEIQKLIEYLLNKPTPLPAVPIIPPCIR